MFNLDEVPLSTDYAVVSLITLLLFVLNAAVHAVIWSAKDHRSGAFTASAVIFGILALLSPATVAHWLESRDAPAIQSAEQTFKEELRKQYHVTNIVPNDSAADNYWGSFIHEAAEAETPLDAPTAHVYGDEGVVHEYSVMLDNNTGEIDLYVDGDSDAPFVAPADLRK